MQMQVGQLIDIGQGNGLNRHLGNPIDIEHAKLAHARSRLNLNHLPSGRYLTGAPREIVLNRVQVKTFYPGLIGD